LSGWKVRGARTWKEVVLDACPPVLLYPLYQSFLRTLQLINRETSERNGASSPSSLKNATVKDRSD